MVEFEAVFSDYINTKRSHSLVPGKSDAPALKAIRQDIPNMLRQFVDSAGYSPTEFHIHGSVGEPNRSFAKVPWVAIFKKSITRSAQRGYYIVLLFAEDMSSVTVSLNQGYTAFEKRYIYPKLAREKLQDCAREAAAILPRFPGFTTGPICLNTAGTLARGYEAGSILAKSYLAGATPPSSEVEEDIHQLLEAYLKLAAHHPVSLIDLDVGISETGFQEAVENIASEQETDTDGVIAPSTTGPQPPPPKGKARGQSKFTRSPAVASRALAMSKAICALATVEEPHLSFISMRSKRNYVEAHHLIPFSQQGEFLHSLDVEENITALCPNCHKMLHYGTGAEKAHALKTLLRDRGTALEARGIAVTLDQLKRMYRTLADED